MVKNILNSALNNFQAFLVTWVVIIIVNQLFIFGACFAPYCLLAALPHTCVIAVLLNYFLNAEESNKQLNSSKIDSNSDFKYTQVDNHREDNEFEETEIPFCPKCGSKMALRTAKNGAHAGNKFWGCSKYPKCKGLLNI
ncbi:topoisomerase DNA-binding C4 zinc finger domain-containing protein [Shewanella sp. T24-MNA-CIBAN-0130]|uniref:topoisomerase DNA-binding C4 zinc finger domain-containing protein n=1 Tax=Shewanella sp. T24-MNA-CIBAN-0130 TaxID=3140470 RepID=UPI00333129E4